MSDSGFLGIPGFGDGSPPRGELSVRAVLKYDDRLRDLGDDVIDRLVHAKQRLAVAERVVAAAERDLSDSAGWRPRQVVARSQARRDLADARSSPEQQATEVERQQNLSVAISEELARVDQWLSSHATDDPRVQDQLAARDRTYSGHPPAGVIVYDSAAEFAAGDGRRATRVYDRSSEADNATILGGSDWGYRWRLELDPGRRSHFSEWRLSWLGTGEFYAVCLRPDVRLHGADPLANAPVWLIAELAPAGESFAELTLNREDTDWLRELERHQHERNSLLLAVEEIQRHYRPAHF